MRIEKDKYLNKWVVWLIDESLLTEIYRGNTKKECKEFIEKRKARKI